METSSDIGLFKEFEMRALCEEGGRAYLKTYFAEEEGRMRICFDKDGFRALSEIEIRDEEEALIFVSGFCEAYLRAEDCLLGPEGIAFSEDSVYLAIEGEGGDTRDFDVRFAYMPAERGSDEGFDSAKAFLRDYLRGKRSLDRFGSIGRLIAFLEQGFCSPLRVRKYAGELRRELRLNAF